MNSEGDQKRVLLPKLDRSVSDPVWTSNSNGLYFQYDDHGRTKIGYISLEGEEHEKLATDIGGSSMGRPYSGGSFSVSNGGTIACNVTNPDMPGELATIHDGQQKILTHLNEDLLPNRLLGETEEFWFESSHDQRQIQGWITKPPHFDPSKKYPLIIENHGGPISNYGWRFSPEIQLLAAAGYVVYYPNPRGSTSYGEEFGNLMLLSDGYEVLGEQPFQRAITGGTGPYVNARGTVTQTILGMTEEMAMNYRFTIDVRK